MADYNNYTMNEKDWEDRYKAGDTDQYGGVAVGNGVAETPAPSVATPTYSEPPKPSHWYEQVFKEENGDLNLSEEDRKKLRRRERAERTIAGLGDLGAHIANVWGAAKGSTPAKIDKTMSEAYDKKWREMGLDYDQRRRAYNAGLSAARKMDYQQYLNDRRQYLAEAKQEQNQAKLDYQIEQKRLEYLFKEKELALRERKSEAEIRRIEQMIAESRQRAAYYRAKAEHPYAPQRNGGYTKSTTYQRDSLGNVISKNESKVADGGSAGASNSGNNGGRTGILLPNK